MGSSKMSNFQFFVTLFCGWTFHAVYAAMRRMQREIEQDEIQANRDRYYR